MKAAPTENPRATVETRSRVSALFRPFAMAVVAVLSSCSSPGSQEPGSTENEAVTAPYTLFVSASSTRSSARALNGAHLSGLEYVFTSNAPGSINPTGIQQVSYWLDNPGISGTPTHVEHATPYDFAGTAGNMTAKPWNTANVAAGTHTITQLVAVAGNAGPPQSYTATFTVGSSGATYLGCYADTSTRDLPYAALSGSVSVEACLSACASKGYRYAGVQHGSQCFCGSSYGKYGKATDCNMACSADAAEICGGSWANSIYSTMSNACVPTTCTAQGKNCGAISDGCGGTLECGNCTPPNTCGGSGTPNVCGTSSGTTYSTSFPLTENPISESGRWVGGQAAGGNLWGNVQTTPGFAFGVSNPTQFGDPTAILTGSWGPDQTVQATARVITVPSQGEIELRLRSTISANSIKGYEALCTTQHNPNYGIQIVRWNGGNGQYVVIGGGPVHQCVNGDVIKATITGTNPTTIKYYINGALFVTACDNGQGPGGSCGGFTYNGPGGPAGPWTSGNPGFGFYDAVDGHLNYFGFSSFAATDGPSLP
jgi:hypothetical protein